MLEWIVSSAVLCALVIGLRYLLRGRIGLRLQYALWGLVLLRLLLPVSFGSSRFSIMNALPEEGPALAPAPAAFSRPDAAVSPLPEAAPYPAGSGGLVSPPRTEAQPTPLVPKTELPAAEPEKNPPDAGQILRILWLAGAAACLLWFAGVNLRFAGLLRRSRERFAGAADFPLPVYETAAAETPCLFGLFRPAVYLPPEAAEDPALSHILAHELTHFRHGDQAWSLLRSLALAIHWFDPLVWWAAFLSRRDGELACDEGTLRRLGEGERSAYGRTLLRMTCASRPALFRAATTMTGSKRGLRERIRLIAKKPKTALLALVAAALIAALGAACTFTGAKKPVEYNDEWFAETAWPYAEEYAKANALSLTKENYQVLRLKTQEAEVYFPVENAKEVLAVTFSRKEDGTWAALEQNPVRDIPRERGFSIEVDVPDWPSQKGNPALSYVIQLASDWNAGYLPGSSDPVDKVNRIVRVRLTGLTPMGTGRTGLTSGDELYRLEYRLLPEDQEHLDLPEGMRTEIVDGETWITEWSADGQPYLLLRWMDPDGNPELEPEREPVWVLAGETNTRELEEVYSTPEMLEKYGDRYTAAAAELYAVYRDSPEPLAEDGGTGIFYLVEMARAAAEACAKENSLSLTGDVYTENNAADRSTHMTFLTTKNGVFIGVSCIQDGDGTWRLYGDRPVILIDRYCGVQVENEVSDAPPGAVSIAQAYLYNLVANMNGGYPWESLFTIDWLPSQISHRADYRLESEAEAPEVNRIVRARLTGFTPMGAGTAGIAEGRDLYRLEYRLLPEDQENIVLCTGMRTEMIDGEKWITEWGEYGQVYILIGWEDPDGNPEEPRWTWLGTTNTRQLEETYGTQEMLEKYGDMYTAAAAVLYETKSREVVGRAISLQWYDVTLRVGESVSPLAGVEPSLAGERITWISGDPAVATVSQDGRVTAVNQGVTKIIASAGGYTAECTVRVHGVAPEPEQSGYDVLAQGQLRWVEESETAVWMPIENLVMIEGHSYPQIVEVSSSLQGEPISWISEDPDVAEVNEKGVITAVNPGTTKVTITVGEYSAECTVRVEKYPPDPAAGTGEGNGITLDRSVISLLAGTQYLLTPDLAPELSGTEVVWSSDDPEIASVSPEGLVTAVGWGTTRVYAAAGDRVTDCVVMVMGYARRGGEEDGYPVNERGETYGGIKDLNGVTLEPDLEAAAGFTPEGEEIDGYVRTFDLYNGGPV